MVPLTNPKPTAVQAAGAEQDTSSSLSPAAGYVLIRGFHVVPSQASDRNGRLPARPMVRQALTAGYAVSVRPERIR